MLRVLTSHHQCQAYLAVLFISNYSWISTQLSPPHLHSLSHKATLFSLVSHVDIECSVFDVWHAFVMPNSRLWHVLNPRKKITTATVLVLREILSQKSVWNIVFSLRRFGPILHSFLSLLFEVPLALFDNLVELFSWDILTFGLWKISPRGFGTTLLFRRRMADSSHRLNPMLSHWLMRWLCFIMLLLLSKRSLVNDLNILSVDWDHLSHRQLLLRVLSISLERFESLTKTFSEVCLSLHIQRHFLGSYIIEGYVTPILSPFPDQVKILLVSEFLYVILENHICNGIHLVLFFHRTKIVAGLVWREYVVFALNSCVVSQRVINRRFIEKRHIVEQVVQIVLELLKVDLTTIIEETFSCFRNGVLDWWRLSHTILIMLVRTITDVLDDVSIPFLCLENAVSRSYLGMLWVYLVFHSWFYWFEH